MCLFSICFLKHFHIFFLNFNQSDCPILVCFILTKVGDRKWRRGRQMKPEIGDKVSYFCFNAMITASIQLITGCVGFDTELCTAPDFRCVRCNLQKTIFMVLFCWQLTVDSTVLYYSAVLHFFFMDWSTFALAINKCIGSTELY